jgi:hypothetical protein
MSGHVLHKGHVLKKQYISLYRVYLHWATIVASEKSKGLADWKTCRFPTLRLIQKTQPGWMSARQCRRQRIDRSRKRFRLCPRKRESKRNLSKKRFNHCPVMTSLCWTVPSHRQTCGLVYVSWWAKQITWRIDVRVMTCGSASNPNGRIFFNVDQRYAIQCLSSSFLIESTFFIRIHSHPWPSLPMIVWFFRSR